MQIPRAAIEGLDSAGGGPDTDDRGRVCWIFVTDKASIVLSSANGTRNSRVRDSYKVASWKLRVSAAYTHTFIAQPSLGPLPSHLLAVVISFQQACHLALGVAFGNDPRLFGRVVAYGLIGEHTGRKS
jgi:hypothetical protein